MMNSQRFAQNLYLLLHIFSSFHPSPLVICVFLLILASDIPEYIHYIVLSDRGSLYPPSLLASEATKLRVFYC
jgi:hypothetical protein